MRDNRFSIFLVFIIFFIFFNHGQKIKGNDNRRSTGLVPHPRVGRNSDTINYPRSDRALGMVHYPRVGRSDTSSLGSLNRLHDLSSDADIEFYVVRDLDADAFLDPDCEDYPNGEMIFKHGEKKDGSWFIPDRIRGYKEIRPEQKIDNPISYYILRGSRSSSGPGGYTPRLGREHDGTNFL